MADATAPAQSSFGLPEDFRRQIQGLEGPDIREWASSKARDLNTRLLPIKSAHNSTLAVHRLPSELIAQVFHMVGQQENSPWKGIDQQDDLHNGLEWLKFMGVCRYWRTVAIDNPLLWTTIDATQSPSFVSLCLERSRQASIHVKTCRLSCVDIISTYSAIAVHTHRIASLSFRTGLGPSLRTLGLLLDCPMPLMTSLKLRKDDRSYLQLESFPNSVRHPQLHHITLIGVPHAWDTNLLSLSSLITLEIVDAAPRRPSLQQYLDLFKAFPSLQFLRLIQAGVRLPADARGRQVSLPNLRRLVIDGSAEGALSILAHLSLPDTVRVVLKCQMNVGPRTADVLPPGRLLKRFIPRNTTGLPAISDVQSVWLAVSPDFIQVKAGAGCRARLDPIFDLSFVLPPYTTFTSYEHLFCSVIRELEETFPVSIRSLAIECFLARQDTKLKAAVARLSRAIPALEHLDLVHGTDILEDGANHSGCSDFPSNWPVMALTPTDADVPWPQLQRLTVSCSTVDILTDDYGLTSLLACLRIRAKMGSRLQGLRLEFSRQPKKWDELRDSFCSVVGAVELSCPIPMYENGMTAEEYEE